MIAKHEWMEQEERQSMYDWIEGAYGERIDQDDESCWAKTVDVYHDYVRKLVVS